MIWVRFKDTAGGPYTEVPLHPMPQKPEYPERRSYKLQATMDGATVVQRPLRDSRLRRWVWKRYRPTITPYENQWQLLATLEYRTRLLADKYPVVEIFDDESSIGGFDALTTGGEKIWTKVRFLQVHRTLSDGGGRIIFDESIVEFVIADADYSDF